MNPDIIDLIYQHEEVEGIAVFSIDGALQENQLTINQESTFVVFNVIEKIRADLLKADRKLKGFLLKSEKLTIQICILEEYLLILQLAEPYSATSIENKIRSVFKEQQVPTSVLRAAPAQPNVERSVALPPISGVSIENNTITQPLIQEANKPSTIRSAHVPLEQIHPKLTQKVTINTAEIPPTPKQNTQVPAEVEQIVFSDFKTKIIQLLKRVAPNAIAQKMLLDVVKAENIDLNIVSIDKPLALAIGEKAIAKIPNAGKRKLIIKEYQSFIKTL